MAVDTEESVATPEGSSYHRFLEAMLRMRMMLFERTLALTTRGWWLLCVLSLLLGLVTYASMQWVYQGRLISAIKAVDGIEDFCAETEGLDPATCRGSDAEGRRVSQQLLWALLIEAEVIDATEAETPVELDQGLRTNRPAFAVSCFLQNSVLTVGADDKPDCKPSNIEPPATKSGTLDLVLGLAWSMCQNASSNAAPEFQKNRIAHFLAGIYPDTISDASGELTGGPQWTDFIGVLLSGLRLAPSSSISDVEIISELTRLSHAQFALSDEGRQGYRFLEADRCVVSTLDAHDEFRRMQAFQKLGAFLLGRVGSNPAVRTATTELTYWTGPEQLFLIIMGYFALVLILLRGLASLATARGAVLARDNIRATTRSERRLETFVTNWLKAKATDPDPAVRSYWKDLITDELISGRWPVRFAIATLPAIGFIGTVRGILLSLSNADAIVWASTQADRADAISTLSGSLGLAFATTMIALLIGVFISLLSALEGRFEERTMLTLFREGKVGASPVPPLTPAVPAGPSPNVSGNRPPSKRGGKPE
ncbi:MotA/TolQ/ExbB proton channel family protein [uncultured Devosia sp.]|uniref:MotA/TolQ/ExbB proton channel family protein n=1 Tax=uncultured Devosia sp. TaxID=211434 RepID=UPI0026041BE5|nr:MotA/TolQ/ExbB proton channel family protein [uncultured Devosia sp.]